MLFYYIYNIHTRNKALKNRDIMTLDLWLEIKNTHPVSILTDSTNTTQLHEQEKETKSNEQQL